MIIEASEITSIKPTTRHGAPMHMLIDARMTYRDMQEVFCLIWEQVGDDGIKRWLESEDWCMLKMPITATRAKVENKEEPK